MTESMIFNAVYADHSFGKISLGEMINRGGASGKIYKVQDRPELVAKIFHNTNKSKTTAKSLRRCS